MREQRLSPSERRLFRALGRRRTREETGLFLAEGVRVCEELVRAAVVPRIAAVASNLADTPRGAALHEALAARCEVRVLAEHDVAALAETESPQGVVVAAEVPSFDPAAIALPSRATLLVLDAVQDPGNFGTLVRCALAFGTAAVCVLPGTVDAWNPKAVRAAAGASFHVPLLPLGAADAIVWLRERDITLYVADAGGTPLPELRSAPRSALVVGNEGAGVSAALHAAAERAVAIPMAGPAESLNVAVAAGILLYHFAQQRALP